MENISENRYRNYCKLIIIKMLINLKQTLSILAIAILTGACGTNKTEEYLNSRNTNKQQTFNQFKNAKFGLFIHWGLYSIPAGVWNG